MQDLSWPIIIGLASTGILMALLSSLVGMRQKVEMPAWWGLYAIWVVIVLATGNETPFRTILFASVLAGLVHSITQCVLLDAYLKNNPWYAEQMDKPRSTIRIQFLVSGPLIGLAFGGLVAGIAWGIVKI